jgi:hypothetical protein
MDVDIIMNIVKYDSNKRQVIYNISQQEVGTDSQLLENFSFEEDLGNPQSIAKGI